MSDHHPRRGAPGRHPTHRAIWTAAAAIILLAVGACSNTASVGTSAAAVAATSIGPACEKPAIFTGSGSTFDAPFFAVAFASYQQQHPGVTIGYSAVGSSAGITAISAQQVDFGAADVPMTATEQAAAKGGPITQVPVDLGGEGIAYNLNLPAGARLHRTGPVLAAIYLGPDDPMERPSPHRAQPGPVCPSRMQPLTSCTAPTAAAPPTSSATTYPSVSPGLGLQGRHRQDSLTGRSAKATKATAG